MSLIHIVHRTFKICNIGLKVVQERAKQIDRSTVMIGRLFLQVTKKNLMKELKMAGDDLDLRWL